mmetsp:Transcript_46554/g.111584  ORF Transcript_46554/g.111584 Transcript_46554/m.111584 type:complete len:212 (-) Transcript_46554:807-1442(-)
MLLHDDDATAQPERETARRDAWHAPRGWTRARRAAAQMGQRCAASQARGLVRRRVGRRVADARPRQRKEVDALDGAAEPYRAERVTQDLSGHLVLCPVHALKVAQVVLDARKLLVDLVVLRHFFELLAALVQRVHHGALRRRQGDVREVHQVAAVRADVYGGDEAPDLLVRDFLRESHWPSQPPEDRQQLVRRHKHARRGVKLGPDQDEVR